ncbi:MAG: efflux RND transporter periplasmic adaptor subunit, partial [Dehalococcoidia bacterium]|nr:efflux RND transporter periplasmic adaptor subunit [Dehalococcoidia bacterium]
MTIYAPVGGTVIHKNAQEGMYVKTGTRIYTLADLSQVWIKLDAYESDLEWLRPGQKVQFTTVSYPGEIFVGTISFIDPVLDPKTRTVKIRVNVPNPQGKLKPQMFVKAVVRAQIAGGGRVMEPDLAGKWICPMHRSIIEESAGNCDICKMSLVPIETLGYVSVDPAKMEKPLVIPVSAAMVTGSRAIVYLQIDPSLLQPESVIDWPKLLLQVKQYAAEPSSTAGKLSQDAAVARAVERFWSDLSPALRQGLLDTPTGETPPVKLWHHFARQVNDLLNTQTLGDAELWQAKELPSEAKKLLAFGPQNLPLAKRTRLNRLLLGLLFPGVLSDSSATPTY